MRTMKISKVLRNFLLELIEDRTKLILIQEFRFRKKNSVMNSPWGHSSFQKLLAIDKNGKDKVSRVFIGIDII